MRNIWTIARRELGVYFISPVAYVVLTMFLLVSGYFFSVILFYSREASLRGVTQNVVVTLLFLIPLITMKLFAEERKLGTLEILLTKPVRDIEVILGKFLAAVLFYGVMLGATLVYVLILKQYGTPDMGPIYAGYLGLVLLGLSFISVGIFCSTLSENQIISAVIGFALILLLWVFDWIGGVAGASEGGWLSYVSLSAHFEDFSKGVIDLKDVVYYLTFIFFWLFLTAKSLQVRKWK